MEPERAGVIVAVQLPVPKGARFALRHRMIRHILIEWNGYGSGRLGADPSEFMDILGESGYRPVRSNQERLDEIRRGWRGGDSAVNLLFRFRRTGP